MNYNVWVKRTIVAVLCALVFHTLPLIKVEPAFANDDVASADDVISAIEADIDSLPGNAGTPIQAMDTILTSSSLTLGVWRDNQGFVKTIPVSSGVLQWSQASAWAGPIGAATLPGLGLAGFDVTGTKVQISNSYVIGNILTQAYWNENKGYYRTVTIDSNGVIQWPCASCGWNGPVSPTHLPEAKTPDSTLEYMIGSNLRQVVWHFDRVYYRDVPIVNGSPVWPSCLNASCWSTYNLYAGFPAPIRAAAAIVVGNILQETVFVDGDQYYRTSTITNGQLNNTSAVRPKQGLSPNISSTSPACFTSVQNTTSSSKTITVKSMTLPPQNPADMALIDSFVWQRADWKTTQSGCTQVPPNVVTTDLLWSQCTTNPTGLTTIIAPTSSDTNFNVSLTSGKTHAIRVGALLKGTKEPLWSGMPWGFICYVKRN